MAISDWPASERPREKLIEKGASALSDAELLAIFLRTGVSGKNAVELARELLTHFGSLTKLCSTDLDAFSQLPGMGPAKFAQLQAVMEMARRALAEEIRNGDIMDSPQSVRNYLRLSIGGKPHEIFVGIFLDARHRTIATEELFRGTLTQASVYPREVVKRALFHNAAAIIFAHNHPSGVAEPSQADETLTQSLKQALALVDIRVLDHFVIGSEAVVSFAERGLI
ncbi:MAG TPA: DNA repair protein RadC [Nitrosomonas halophila]|nr:DNA repair protein RadC [Nitrosomonas halophila]